MMVIRMGMPKGKKILIAEDDTDIRCLVAYSLEYVGYDVVQALNGDEAVELAESERPDLILLDVRMPRMNGYEACAVLRSRESTRDIPVVFLSARGQEAEIRRGLDMGAEEYILKPFAPDDLYQRVGSILDRLERE
jgi:DNA-binding response OmpR family regulator